MMDIIESYILDNYTSPDFPQKYESFIKANYQDVVPDLILGDETLTDITNKVIKGDKVDDSYLGSFKEYCGECVYEPEVDFTNALALQARYIDDAEYLEWLNNDKIAKVLAEFPTRGDLIDHLGPTLKDIADKYGSDPNINLLINNMTYKSHPLAFYEFSQSDDFSEQEGDFGFRSWIRKGINSILRITTRNRIENALSRSSDASVEDSYKLTTGDLKNLAKNGTSEQKELAQEILDKKKQLVTNSLASGGTLASGVISGGLVEKVSEVPLKVTNSLSPGALTQSSIRALGPTHDPNIWLQGQVRNAWEMSEKNCSTTEDQVIKHLKGLKDSGELKLEDVPKKKYSRSDSSTGEIPMGPAKNNSMVNAGLKDRPNEFSESVDDLLIERYKDVNKKLNKSEAIYNKVTSLLTKGDMNANDSYLSSDWVSNKSDRKTLDKYRKEQLRKKEFKEAKSKINKELGIKDNSDLISTVAKVAAPILVSKLSNPNPSKDTELEKLRLENENLKLRQQQRYSRDHSEGQDFDNPYDDVIEDHNYEVEDHKNGGSNRRIDPKTDSNPGNDSPSNDKNDDPKSDPPENPVVIKPKDDLVDRPESDNKGDDEPGRPEDEGKDNVDPPKKPRTSRPRLTEEEQLENAERAAASDKRAAELGMHFEGSGKGPRRLVKDAPKAKTTEGNDEEPAKLGKDLKTDENGKRNLVDNPAKEDKPLENKSISRRSVKSELRNSGALNGLTHAQKKELISRTQESRRQSNFKNSLVIAGLKSPSSASNSNLSRSSNNSGNLSGLLSSASSSIKGIGDEITKSKVYKDFKRSQVMNRVGNASMYLLDKAGSGLKALISPGQNNRPPVN